MTIICQCGNQITLRWYNDWHNMWYCNRCGFRMPEYYNKKAQSPALIGGQMEPFTREFIVYAFALVAIVLLVGAITLKDLPEARAHWNKTSAWCAAGHKIVVNCSRGILGWGQTWQEEICEVCKLGREGITVTDCPCGPNSNYGGEWTEWRWIE